MEAILGTLKTIIEVKNKGEELEEEKLHLSMTCRAILDILEALESNTYN
jgi:hypothetical protein